MGELRVLGQKKKKKTKKGKKKNKTRQRKRQDTERTENELETRDWGKRTQRREKHIYRTYTRKVGEQSENVLNK